MSLVRVLTTGALALGLSAGAAFAVPSGGMLARKSEAAPSLVEKVHGCHRICRLGPAGWHYHAGPLCVRVPCVAFPGGPWIWHCGDGVCGWWHPARRVWWK